ncbi:MAG: DUF2147 domain-containing protein [Candidatus Pedobacter colombiensis]|uniref:DUF2147 domain-containing protein n=1 Tax=Candidatus Pedobacter colombiensis TaxID=3121371 RepID=A0AAJ5W619_9SPHI|nr:DUF2147 domain-containing protein [Pedobacter sp.]WEK18637.1 MAG: DUF2147 domain-containing protein [Pedobacter sp.]
MLAVCPIYAQKVIASAYPKEVVFKESSINYLPDKIVGKWISEKKNLIVEIYKSGIEFKAKVVWFDDQDDLSSPMDNRTDFRNPDPALRSRKLLGMEVLKQLKFKEESNSWEDGIIYDSINGKEWSSCAFFTDSGHLRVKGYWKLKMLCKSMDFLPYKGHIK